MLVELAGALATVVAELVVGEELELLELGVELPELPELPEEPDECEPPSGSTYCWSPADGPAASAGAAANRANAQTSNSQVASLFGVCTLRVLQAVKLLAFSDLHRDRDQARLLADRAGEADVVVAAGDFASFHIGLRGVIDVLSEIAVPTVLVPGNNETDTALWRACGGWEGAHVLHGEAAEIDGVQFFGLGAGVPKTPLPWSFDLSEEDAASKLERCPEGAILVVHSPPKGHVDKAHGRRLGSEAILRAIERTRPRVTLCGHIHNEWGHESQVGPTRIMNLGPQGILFEL